ncbi:hypothetical protein DAI22_09g011500 [Oryza sativa Japonica Group]|nr:hypothetical protein DAI22_09g011500 [Oryza sativa Japonica Group]
MIFIYARTSARGVPSLYVWIPVEAPLVCGADRRGSTARRTHEEEKVEPLVLYFGTYRPGIPSPGCYLVLNTWANSVAIIPPLHTTCVTSMSHCGIGTGVTILRHNDYYDYVLVELFSHQDTRTHLASNKWIQKEVLLPIPASNQEKDDVTWPPTYSFRADMVFAVLTTSLCWVDLRTGILVCDHIDKLSTGTDDDDDHLLLFFISLPEECVMKPSLLSWKRLAEEHRTMICRDPETILFISMDNYIQGLPIGDTVLTTWTLKFPLTNHWTWEKHSAPSLFVGDLLNDLPVLKLKNPRMIGRRCTLPTARMRGSMSKGIGESRDSVRDQH